MVYYDLFGFFFFIFINYYFQRVSFNLKSILYVVKMPRLSSVCKIYFKFTSIVSEEKLKSNGPEIAENVRNVSFCDKN